MTKNEYKIVGGGLAHLKSRIEEIITLLKEVDAVKNKDDEANFIFDNLIENLNKKGSEYANFLNDELKRAEKLFYLNAIENAESDGEK